jgi:hypothetical protein
VGAARLSAHNTAGPGCAPNALLRQQQAPRAAAPQTLSRQHQQIVVSAHAMRMVCCCLTGSSVTRAIQYSHPKCLLLLSLAPICCIAKTARAMQQPWLQQQRCCTPLRQQQQRRLITSHAPLNQEYATGNTNQEPMGRFTGEVHVSTPPHLLAYAEDHWAASLAHPGVLGQLRSQPLHLVLVRLLQQAAAPCTQHVRACRILAGVEVASHSSWCVRAPAGCTILAGCSWGAGAVGRASDHAAGANQLAVHVVQGSCTQQLYRHPSQQIAVLASRASRNQHKDSAGSVQPH